MKQSVNSFCLVFALAFSCLLSGCVKEPTTPTSDPQFLVSEDTLVFHGNETLTLELSVVNSEGIDYSLQIPKWVEAQPNWGYIEANNPMLLKLTSNLDDFLFATENQMTVCTSIGNKNIILIGVPNDQLLYTISDSTLFFTHDIDIKTISITNTGNIAFNYTISASTEFVTLSSPTGTVQIGEQVEIGICIDRDNIVNEPNTELYVSINERIDTIPLLVEKKKMLDAYVIDAEYSKATNLLVYVADNNTLNIYHPESRTIDAIPLLYTPNCVSVSSDGTKAVVGHDAHVSYVDLQTQSLLYTFDISCNSCDIVLADNGWAYIFPTRDQWVKIHCINVTVPGSHETLSPSIIYAGAKGKMHPSGKCIYAADNGISPSNIYRIDIQNGTAVLLYGSPDYLHSSIDGNLWISEDGNRIFVRGGSVMKASDIQNLDLTYNGKISFEGEPSWYKKIVCLDHLESTKSLYIIMTPNPFYSDEPNPPFIYVHHSDDLTYQHKIGLEDYYITDNQGNISSFTPEPYFVFANSNGQQLYVITKAVGSGLIKEWAVQTIDL